MVAARKIDWFVIVTSVVFAVSCSGSGCGGCTTFSPIPGGFAPAKRTPNAVQLRVTSGGFSFINANAPAIIGPLAGGAQAGVVNFSVPASCSSDPHICCDSNNNPVSPCGPVDIDLNPHAGDPAPLDVAPQSGASTLKLTINTRVKTEMDIPASYSGVRCGVQLDSTQGTKKYITLTADLQFTQDTTTGTTRLTANNVQVTNLESSDVSLNGGVACGFASFFLGFATSYIGDAIAGQIQSTINDATCKKCPSGDVAECGSSFATACTNGVCQEGNQCLQEFGIDGRAKSVSLFGGLSPGTGGGIDVYEVAGGYATTNNSGAALGLLGGMEPAGAPRDLCGPAAAEPAVPSITPSAYFQGNTRPDTGAAFHVGVGIHQSQLDQLAYAGYDGGLLCLTVGHSTVSQLTTDTISLLSRSLQKLVQTNSPMAVGIRPQSPPTLTLGKNTFTTDSSGNQVLSEPLIDVKFKALEIDFFAEVDQQWVRVFTVVADVHLPVGMQVGAAGQLTPVIGNPQDAFTNISVKNSDAVVESPDTLAGLFPSILGLVLPQLSNGLSPISLPSLGGLAIDVQDITAVDNDQYLALFANLAVPVMRQPVKTTVDVVAVEERPDAVMQDPKQWAAWKAPAVTLQLGGDASDLEWQIKLDGGSWSAWSKNPRPQLAPQTFWLAGVHKAEVRARRVGRPETVGDTVTVELPIGVATTRALARTGNGFHGQAGATGCACDSRRGGAANGALMALVVLAIMLPLKRWRRRLARLGKAAWIAAVACLPACDCGSAPCGSQKCEPGEVTHAPGKWTSIASDDKRVMVATYDPVNGDVVVVDATKPDKLVYKVVDGVPEGTPTYDPSTYRGGIAEAGPDVGAWTSIAIANHRARVAYQDRDALALKYAEEDGSHNWHAHIVDDGGGMPVGEYANMVVDANGHPAIAYISVGNDDGMGHRVTNLQLARATKTDPGSPTDWTISTIASAPGTCAGLCTGGQVCVADANGGAESCVTPGTCGAACGSGTACVNNACVNVIADPMVDDVATGTGLFVSLVVLPDGRLAAAYYDRTRRALVLGVESGAGTSSFAETILDGNVAGADRGMWSAAVAAPDGTVHVAYQDALGDQLMYTTWNGAPGTPEIVDDGERTGDRTHPVGAGAAIYLIDGTPAIAYQDGMVSDVYVATRGPSSWSVNPIATGRVLDGFSIGATIGPSGAPVLAWDARDPMQDPPNLLSIVAP